MWLKVLFGWLPPLGGILRGSISFFAVCSTFGSSPFRGASRHALGLHLAGCCFCVASLSRVVSVAMLHFGTCVWPAHHCRLSGRLHARVWAMAPDLHLGRGGDLAKDHRREGNPRGISCCECLSRGCSSTSAERARDLHMTSRRVWTLGWVID